MLTYLQPFDEIDSFPPLEKAEAFPNGLLAIGGDLSPQRLLHAYQRGIFPWFSENEMIQWWSPDPRMVLYPDEFHTSRSLKKNIRKNNFEYSVDQAFEDVIQACSEPRNSQQGTWITKEMKQAYTELHKTGKAHSLEIWKENQLVGGLYGIAIGQVFFGESMFSRVSDASKAAFLALTRSLGESGFQLIDCQVYSEHLETLGAREIDRRIFEKKLQQYCSEVAQKLTAIKPQRLFFK
jgi:leucyl/phenylalanyl-tRNA--protein transferase